MHIQEAYSLFGLDKNASDDDIKKRYRELAMKHHPDKNGGDKESEDIFKKVTEAYEILSNRNNPQQHQQQGFNVNDIFRDMFAGFNFDFENAFRNEYGTTNKSESIKRNIRSPRNAQNISSTFNVTIGDILNKTPIRIEAIKKINNCPNCNGVKVFLENETKCNVCNGTGMRTESQGFFKINHTCNVCGGMGIKFDQCNNCDQNGFIFQDSPIEISLNIADKLANQYRLQGFGIPSKNKEPEEYGDLILQLIVIPNDILCVRDGLLSNTNPIIVSASDIINAKTIQIQTWNYITEEYEHKIVDLPNKPIGFGSTAEVKIREDRTFAYEVNDLGLENKMGSRSDFLVYAQLDEFIR